MQELASSAPALYPNLFSPEKGYVFVVTYGRSGSTVLQNVLNAIEGYCIRGENGNLAYHLCKCVATIEDERSMVLRREALRQPPQSRPPEVRSLMGGATDPWYGAEMIDPDHVAKRLFDGFVESCLNLPTGTRVGGVKEIRFGHDLAFMPRYLDILHRHFPGARFIINLRDLDEVLRSGWYRDQFRWKMRPRLKRVDRALEAYAEAHPERCHVMRYEDYKGRPDAFAPLFAFLDEPFDADLVSKVLNRKLGHLQKSSASGGHLMLRKLVNLFPSVRRLF